MDGQYNALASIWFQTPEASVRSLFHDPPDTHNAISLAVFVIAYFLLAAWTFGLASSNGLFIPTLLTGAAWGRLVSIGMYYIFPDVSAKQTNHKFEILINLFWSLYLDFRFSWKIRTDWSSRPIGRCCSNDDKFDCDNNGNDWGYIVCATPYRHSYCSKMDWGLFQ